MIEMKVLRVVVDSPGALSAHEVCRRADLSSVVGLAAVRRVSASLVSLSGRGLVIRHAGRTARYEATQVGRQVLSDFLRGDPRESSTRVR